VVRLPLGVSENNIGNGGKHKNKGFKIKTQNKVMKFGLQREIYVEVVTRPAHH
jgi:hypothetical protein